LRTIDAPDMEALVELMFLAASADGEFSAAEKQHFLRSVESLTDRQIPESTMDALFARFTRQLQSSGRAACLASVKHRLGHPGARKVALSLVIQVVASDGIIRTAEHELLLEVAEALEIDRDMAADLVAKIST
jgi:tellurite resistance protein